MSTLKVRTYRNGSANPRRTVTVPGAVLKLAGKFMPGKTAAFLRDNDIDIAEILARAEEEGFTGLLADIENHEHDERITISLE